MRVPIGIEPTETWEADLCLEDLKYAVELREALVKRAKADRDALPAIASPEDPEAAQAAKDEAEARVRASEDELAAARKQLQEYQPGSGPMFVIGHIPPRHRARVAGIMQDAARAGTAEDQLERQYAWRCEAVRWGVRGHRNLKSGGGREVAFESRDEVDGGDTYKVPTERQIKRYGQILGALANVCLQGQRLPEPEKNV